MKTLIRGLVTLLLVFCCCPTSGGGMCCKEVSVCGSFISGCWCELGLCVRVESP